MTPAFVDGPTHAQAYVNGLYILIEAKAKSEEAAWKIFIPAYTWYVCNAKRVIMRQWPKLVHYKPSAHEMSFALGQACSQEDANLEECYIIRARMLADDGMPPMDF